MTNWKDIEAREAVRIEYEQALQKRLEGLGVQFRRATFTGDSSYPVEYTFRYSFVEAVGPTFDLALVEFVEKLLRYVLVEQADDIKRSFEEHRRDARMDAYHAAEE